MPCIPPERLSAVAEVEDLFLNHLFVGCGRPVLTTTRSLPEAFGVAVGLVLLFT